MSNVSKISPNTASYQPSTSMPRRMVFALLMVIVLAGTFFRFADIGTESLWVDEIYSYRQALKGIAMIIANAPSDVHPPTYYVLLHWWTLIFGTSEAGLRSVSAVCAILTIPLMFVLGRAMFSERIGLYAALLLALSHFHIHYAQEARNYSYTVLVVVVGMIGFVRYLKLFETQQEEEYSQSFSQFLRISWKPLLIYVLTTTLVLYSHFFALFVIVAQNALVASFVVLRKQAWKRLWRSWIALQMLLLVIFSPWLNILYRQINTVRSGFWIDRPNIGTLLETLVEYAGSLSAALIIVPLCLLALVQVRKQLQSDTINENSLSEDNFSTVFWWDYRLGLLVLWLLAPVLLPYILSLESTPIYYVKYTIPALPALLLLAAKGLDAFDMRVRWMQGLVVGIIASLGVIAWRDNRNDWNALEKEIWKEAVQYIDSCAASNDAVFVHDWYCVHNCTYYTKRPDVQFQALPPERFSITPATIERFYAPLATGRERLWLVLSHKTSGTEKILQRIERDFIQVHDSIFPSRYRKYMVVDTFPLQTQGLFLMKTYLSNDIRVLRFERKR
ncbi:MAG: glycosyltransferase family 39 protein [Candidatus Kapabacteria bacterium]|nr:glycosyltransferase family 39 protein [Candidatus Kapabacteria bacterium]